MIEDMLIVFIILMIISVILVHTLDEPFVDFMRYLYEQLGDVYTREQLMVADCTILIIIILVLLLPQLEPVDKIKQVYLQWKSKGESADEKEKGHKKIEKVEG